MCNAYIGSLITQDSFSGISCVALSAIFLKVLTTFLETFVAFPAMSANWLAPGNGTLLITLVAVLATSKARFAISEATLVNWLAISVAGAADAEFCQKKIE